MRARALYRQILHAYFAPFFAFGLFVCFFFFIRVSRVLTGPERGYWRISRVQRNPASHFTFPPPERNTRARAICESTHTHAHTFSLSLGERVPLFFFFFFSRKSIFYILTRARYAGGFDEHVKDPRRNDKLRYCLSPRIAPWENRGKGEWEKTGYYVVTPHFQAAGPLVNTEYADNR